MVIEVMALSPAFRILGPIAVVTQYLPYLENQNSHLNFTKLD